MGAQAFLVIPQWMENALNPVFLIIFASGDVSQIAEWYEKDEK
jgi:hypothetical protein